MHPVTMTRRSFAQSLATGLPLFGIVSSFSETAAAASGHNPGEEWELFDKAEDGGFRSAALQAVERMLYPLPTTSLLVVKAGRVVYHYGDSSHVSYLASARKSVLSMLYGKYVANGTINLDRTVGDLGIEETGGLLPIEKRATIRHLLMASSGVYYPAGSPGGSNDTPPRGSKEPGTYFLYNNWDFNVAGAVFEKLTGKSVFQALEADLAGPLQFQDFDRSRQRMLGYDDPKASRYKAYHMFLSGRDMARLAFSWSTAGDGTESRSFPPIGCPKARNGASGPTTWPLAASRATATCGGCLRTPGQGPSGLALIWQMAASGSTFSVCRPLTQSLFTDAQSRTNLQSPAISVRRMPRLPAVRSTF